MAIAPENARVAITMSKEMREELQERADKDKRTLSNYIVKVLEDKLEEDKQK